MVLISSIESIVLEWMRWKMGGACTKEQQATIEHKLLEEVEAEGLRAAAEAEGETTTCQCKTVKFQ